MPPKAETAEAEAPEEKQGDAAVEDMTIAEKAAHAEGVELAEKYKAEQEARADDDPLVIAQKEREEADEEAAAADEERAKAAEEDDGA